jgi:hypothetical protein
LGAGLGAGGKATAINQFEFDETHFKTGFWISVRASSRRLLRHGAGESSAVPLKIGVTGNPVSFSWCEIRP